MQWITTLRGTSKQQREEFWNLDGEVCYSKVQDIEFLWAAKLMLGKKSNLWVANLLREY